MKATETVIAHGHPLVRGTHPTTFEVTTEKELTRYGDCIIAVGADKGAANLSSEFRNVISREGASLTTRLVCRDISVEVQSSGGKGITLEHPTDLVWRRSSFCCSRTIATGSDHVARTLSRELIKYLQEGETIRVEMTAQCPD
ncbi:MAG: DUF371 domain-containing protein [Methanomicrobiales archaeon]